MLKKGLLTEGRAGLRPLACSAAAALLVSTSSVRAEPPNANDAKTGSAASADIAEVAGSFASFDKSATMGGTAAAAVAPAAVVRPSASAVPPSPPAKDDGTTLRTIGYIAGGVGIVGFIVFAVAGIGAKNTHDRIEETLQACGPRAIDCNGALALADEGKRQQTIANIGLATGLAGVGLGATLIMIGNHSAHDVPAVATGPRGGMITFAGRF